MKQFLYLSLSLWVLISACNDPILVGSVLLEDETLDVEFTDVIDVSAKTVAGDPSITFRDITGGPYSATTYMVGSLEDPVFGKSVTTSYFSPTLISTFPSLLDSNLDSVVLSIPLDSIGFYGDLGATHNLELRAISESMETLVESGSDTLYSDQTIAVEPTIWSTLSSTISYKDSVVIRPYNDQDTLIKIRPELRMQMDKQFWLDLAGPTDTLTAEKLELEVPGFELKSTPSASSIIGLDLYYNTFETQANINFYYRPNDSTRLIYQLPLGNYRHSLFTNDYSGSELGNNIDDPAADQLFVQSQAGTNIEVDLSSVTTLNDRILNYAELELTVLPEDEDLYQPVVAIFPWYRNDEGQLDIVGQPATDLALVESYSGGSRSLTYSIDLTTHLNLIKKGTISNDKIFLIATTKAQRPNRSIILGTNDSESPLKLNLILTKP